MCSAERFSPAGGPPDGLAPPGGSWRRRRQRGEEWEIAKESMCPLTPLGSSPGGEPPAYGYCHLSQVPFVSQPYLCLAAIDEPTRPLRGHPSSTRKGGDLQHAYRFPHFRHGCVVQNKHQSSHPSACPGQGRFFISGLRPQFHPCPFRPFGPASPRGSLSHPHGLL